MTLISDFREMVRVLIDDNDADIQLRENSQIDAALRGVLDCGFVSVSDGNTTYAVNEARTGITPELDPATDPNAFVELTYRAAMMFAPSMGEAWRTRAFSYIASHWSADQRLMILLQGLYEARAANMIVASDYE